MCSQQGDVFREFGVSPCVADTSLAILFGYHIAFYASVLQRGDKPGHHPECLKTLLLCTPKSTEMSRADSGCCLTLRTTFLTVVPTLERSGHASRRKVHSRSFLHRCRSPSDQNSCKKVLHTTELKLVKRGAQISAETAN
jgi:hypothetical protein